MNNQVQCAVCKKMVERKTVFGTWKRWWFCSERCSEVFKKIGRKLLGWDKKVPMFKDKKKS